MSTPDTTPPQTTITSGPAAGSTTNDSTPSFGFSSSEAGSTFQCKVDAAAFGACSGPGATHTTAALADGTHTFQVRATDPSGNTDPTPASRTFTVDTTPPETTITSGPAAGSTTNDSTPSFGFSSSEAGSTFQCKVDAAAFGACSGPGATHTTAALADGQHTFQVRATDPVGNTDPTPASRTFTVSTTVVPPPVLPPAADTTPPETTITKGPPKKTKKKKVTFEFISSEPGSSFECSLDGAPFTPCSSPHKVKAKKKGKHRFEVRARDGAGNVDPSAASQTWKKKKKRKRRR